MEIDKTNYLADGCNGYFALVWLVDPSSWVELCAAVENDPWVVPYRVVTKRLNRKPPGVAARRRELEIADTLFPTMPVVNWGDVELTSGPIDNENEPPELIQE